MINIQAQVNRFAAPLFTLASGNATLVRNGDTYTLDFGTVQRSAPLPQVELTLANAVAAPADSLAGSYMLTGSSFQFGTFAAFSNLAAGQSISQLLVALKTDANGLFTGSISLGSFSENSGGFSGALNNQIINLQGQVIPEPAIWGLLGVALLQFAARRSRRKF